MVRVLADGTCTCSLYTYLIHMYVHINTKYSHQLKTSIALFLKGLTQAKIIKKNGDFILAS